MMLIPGDRNNPQTLPVQASAGRWRASGLRDASRKQQRLLFITAKGSTEGQQAKLTGLSEAPVWI